MDAVNLLVDGFGRIREVVDQTVEGLTGDQLAWQPDGQGNSIAWLVWHLTRVQDDHLAEAAGREQRWIAAGWAEQFQLPFDPGATGYGHERSEVAAVRLEDPRLLSAYHREVYDTTVAWLGGLSPGELDRVVDERWDPPVTLGVRLVSVLADDLQHAGQAAYVRGLLPA
ncbi:MAG: mycothiol transferase [Acidimicrobiales bacterium]